MKFLSPKWGAPWGTPSGFFGQEEESERYKYDGSGSEASGTGGKCQTKSWGVENLEFPNTIFINMMAVKQTGWNDACDMDSTRPCLVCLAMFQRFKKKAAQTVRTQVRLVVEEASWDYYVWCFSSIYSYPNLPILQDNTSNMTKALAATNFGHWKGEVCGETNLVTLKWINNPKMMDLKAVLVVMLF